LLLLFVFLLRSGSLNVITLYTFLNFHTALLVREQQFMIITIIHSEWLLSLARSRLTRASLLAQFQNAPRLRFTTLYKIIIQWKGKHSEKITIIIWAIKCIFHLIPRLSPRRRIFLLNAEYQTSDKIALSFSLSLIRSIIIIIVITLFALIPILQVLLYVHLIMQMKGMQIFYDEWIIVIYLANNKNNQQ
jgi:hypothetical protein